MKTKFFNSLLIFAVIGSGFFSNAASDETSPKCGKSVPRLCLGQTVWTQAGSDWTGAFEAEIIGISEDLMKYSVKIKGRNEMYHNRSVEGLGISTIGLCTISRPRICVGDVIYTIQGSAWRHVRASEVTAISHDRSKLTVNIKVSNENYSSSDPNTFSTQTAGRCGTTSPKLCVGDRVKSIQGNAWRGEYDGVVLAVSYDGKSYTIDFDNFDAHNSNVDSNTLRILRRANSLSLESLNIFFSPETDDTVTSIKAMASVVTKERALFLNQIASSVAKEKSETANLFAGLLVSKLIRLSTAQVVKDHFEPQVQNYLTRIQATGWNSIMQIPGNDQTISLAIHVIAAGVRVRNTQAQVSPETEIKLQALVTAAATMGTFAKANALREFLLENMVLINDLVADPRHGAIGSLVADTAQWVHQQFDQGKK